MAMVKLVYQPDAFGGLESGWYVKFDFILHVLGPFETEALGQRMISNLIATTPKGTLLRNLPSDEPIIVES